MVKGWWGLGTKMTLLGFGQHHDLGQNYYYFGDPPNRPDLLPHADFVALQYCTLPPPFPQIDNSSKGFVFAVTTGASIFLWGQSLREKKGIHNHPTLYHHVGNTGVINHNKRLDQQIVEVCPVHAHMWRISHENLFEFQVETSISQKARPYTVSFSASEIKRHEAQEEDSYNDRPRIPGVVLLSSLICPPKHKWLQDKSICHHREPSTLSAPSTPSIRLPPLPLSHDLLRSFPCGAWEVKNKRGVECPLDRPILMK